MISNFNMKKKLKILCLCLLWGRGRNAIHWRKVKLFKHVTENFDLFLLVQFKFEIIQMWIGQVVRYQNGINFSDIPYLWIFLHTLYFLSTGKYNQLRDHNINILNSFEPSTTKSSLLQNEKFKMCNKKVKCFNYQCSYYSYTPVLFLCLMAYQPLWVI